MTNKKARGLNEQFLTYAALFQLLSIAFQSKCQISKKAPTDINHKGKQSHAKCIYLHKYNKLQ